MTDAQVEVEEKLRRKKEEEEEMWREYAEQRRLQRQKEEEELRKLKERQGKRKEARAQQEKCLSEQKRIQDEKRQKELEEKKTREAEAKRKRLEEAERKRQAMQAAKEKKDAEPVKPNFTIMKREDLGNFAALGGSGMFGKFANVMAARGEMGKTREQLEEDKTAIMAMRVKALDFEGCSVDDLRKKANELWERVKSLEAEKYDLEERRKVQEYDLKELAERQRQISRSRALKKGLDPEALQGPHPPMIQVASKYERRTDRRSFIDKKELFAGGFEAQQDADLEKQWEIKLMTFKDSSSGRLPQWDPENPKNKEVHRRRGLDIDDDDDDEPVYQPPPPRQLDSEPIRQAPPQQQKEEEEEEEEEEDEEEEEEEEEE